MKIKRPVAILLAIIAVFCICPLSGAYYGEACGVPTGPQTTGTSTYMIELNSGKVLYSKYVDDKMYPASTTKLMTALIAAEKIEAGAISLTDNITFSYDAVYGIPRDTMHISIDVGEVLTVEQVLYAMLLPSANEACLGMAEHIAGSVDAFVGLMNQRAAELGMTNSNFVTPNGLHDENHYMSARDLATLMTEVIKHPLLVEIMSTPSYDIPPTNKTDGTRHLTTTNDLIVKDSGYYNSYVVCGKTGYTTPAGNTLATYSKVGDLEYITVIMKAPKGTTFKDTSALINYFAKYLTSKQITSTIDFAKSIPTADGGTLMVEPEQFSVMCHVNDDPLTYERTYSLPEKITEPVAAGQEVGTLTLYDHGYPAATVRMLARDNYGTPVETSVTTETTSDVPPTTSESTPPVMTTDNPTTAPTTSANETTPASSASVITSNNLPATTSSVTTTVKTGSANTSASTTADDNEDEGGSWTDVLVKVLLILLGVVLFCGIVYGVIVLVSVLRYQQKKRSKTSPEPKDTDKNDPSDR